MSAHAPACSSGSSGNARGGRARASARRLAARHARCSLLGARSAAPSGARAPAGRLPRGASRAPGIGVIAEFKRRSPSAGRAARGRRPATRSLDAYERGGAAAISVLTEEAELRRLARGPARGARAACALPILRKDFIVDAYQLHEARARGRRRGAADRRGARRSEQLARAARRRRASSDSTCSSRSTTAHELERARWRPGRA